MSLKIDSERMTSDVTSHYAEWSPERAADGQGAWVVSWLPLRALDRNQAITAMTLAETIAFGRADVPWAHVKNWAAELHLSAEEAVRLLRGDHG